MRKSIAALLFAWLSVVTLPAVLLAQGSIYGTVARSTGGSPDTTSFSFFGFVNGSDNQIRVKGVDGCGYDGVNWWDDFQNYLSHAAGIPYDYYYHDAGNSQTYHLHSLIPSNSFQMQNITTAPATFPAKPVIRSIVPLANATARITWHGSAGATYHVYRRVAGVNGSFFRRDDVNGNLTNAGVVDTFFVDSQVDTVQHFEYVVIAQDNQIRYSPPSKPFAGKAYLCGDADGSGDINASDLVYIINYIFGSGLPPSPMAAGDPDCSGDVNIADAVYLVNYIFGVGPGPCAACK